MERADTPISPEALAPALKTLLSKTAHYGADAADAIATHGRSLSLSVRGGELEDVDNSEGRDVGVRVMVGRRQACVSTSDLSDASLDAVAERAVAMARLAPEDPFAGLADDKDLERAPADLQMFDGGILRPEDLKAKALEIEAATLSVTGVAQAEGAGASWATSGIYFMTSAGFAAGWRSSRHDLGVMAIAAKDGDMERDADFDGARWLGDLRSPEDIGRRAGTRAVSRLGATQMASGAMPVIFDKKVSASLISAFSGAISGSSIARGVSYLKDKLGESVFADNINIIDDPHMLRGHGSRPWDGEGVRTQARKLIDGGQLTSWLLNASAARQLGLQTTGHANRGIGSPPGISASNLYLEAGSQSPDDLMKAAGRGLLITDMFGPSLNQNTGDYSVGVAGFEIKDGQRGKPVSEVTVAGNLIDMFKTLIPASDLEFNAAMSAPSILIEGLTVAGA